MSAFLCGLTLAVSIDYATRKQWKYCAIALLVTLYNAIAWYGGAK